MKRSKGLLNVFMYFIGISFIALIIARLFNFSDAYILSLDYFGIYMSILAVILIALNFDFVKKQFKDNFFKVETYKYGFIGFIVLVTAVFINATIFMNLDPSMNLTSSNEAEVNGLIENASKLQIFVVIGLIVPFVEELIFRASIMGILIGDTIKKSYFPYIICAIIFAFLHDTTLLSDPFKLQNLFYFMMYFIPSLVLCLFYKKTEHNLLAVYLIHILNNSLTVFL